MPGVDNAYTELALSLVGDWLTHVSEKAACFRLVTPDMRVSGCNHYGYHAGKRLVIGNAWGYVLIGYPDICRVGHRRMA